MVDRSASLSDHRYGTGPPFTIGIEEEYMLLDPVTLDLVQRADRLLSAERDFDLGVHLSPELFQSLLEVHTPVCANTAEAGTILRVSSAQLVRRMLRELEPHARELGSDRELEGIRRILIDGNGAEDQRHRFEDSQDVIEVARGISDISEMALLVPA